MPRVDIRAFSVRPFRQKESGSPDQSLFRLAAGPPVFDGDRCEHVDHEHGLAALRLAA
jgi:hypothetical protein